MVPPSCTFVVRPRIKDRVGIIHPPRPRRRRRRRHRRVGRGRCRVQGTRHLRHHGRAGLTIPEKPHQPLRILPARFLDIALGVQDGRGEVTASVAEGALGPERLDIVVEDDEADAADGRVAVEAEGDRRVEEGGRDLEESIMKSAGRCRRKEDGGKGDRVRSSAPTSSSWPGRPNPNVA